MHSSVNGQLMAASVGPFAFNIKPKSKVKGLTPFAAPWSHSATRRVVPVLKAPLVFDTREEVPVGMTVSVILLRLSRNRRSAVTRPENAALPTPVPLQERSWSAQF